MCSKRKRSNESESDNSVGEDEPEEAYVLTAESEIESDDSFEPEPEVITLDDGDEGSEAGCVDKVLQDVEIRENHSSLPNKIVDFDRILEECLTGEEAGPIYNSDGFDIDKFCKSLLMDEDSPKSLLPANKVPLTARVFGLSGDSDEGNLQMIFKTDNELLKNATELVTITLAKAALIKGLSIINAAQPFLEAPLELSKPSGRGFPADDKNPYAKPRLPFLRTSNRKKYAREWRSEKLEKRMASFNARFRRRLAADDKRRDDELTAHVLAETMKLRIGVNHEGQEYESVECDFNPTPDHTYSLPYDPTPDHTYGKPWCEEASHCNSLQHLDLLTNKKECVVGAGERNCSSSTVVGSRFSKPIPESKSLPGLDDFTFLLSPQSEVSMDIDQVLITEIAMKPTILRRASAKRFVKSVNGVLLEGVGKRKSNLVGVESMDSEDEELDFDCELQGTLLPTAPSNPTASISTLAKPLMPLTVNTIGSTTIVPAKPIPSQVSELLETSAVFGDRVYKMAINHLNKKDIGFPRKKPLDLEKYSDFTELESKKGAKSNSMNSIRLESFPSELIDFCKARFACEERGIPSKCLPVISNYSNYIHHPVYSKERKDIRQKTEHMHFLVRTYKGVESKDASTALNSSVTQTIPNTSNSNTNSKVQNVDFQEKSIASSTQVHESVDHLNWTYPIGLIDEIGGSSSNSKTSKLKVKSIRKELPTTSLVKKMNIDYYDSGTDDTISDSESVSSTQLKKMMSKMILREDLISDIESIHSSASSRQVRKIIANGIFKHEDLVSDFDSIHEKLSSTSKVSRQPRKKIAKRIFEGEDLFSELESIKGTETSTSLSSRKVKQMISKNIFREEDLISDINTVNGENRKQKRKARNKFSKKVIEIDLLSDMSSDNELDEVDLPRLDEDISKTSVATETNDLSHETAAYVEISDDRTATVSMVEIESCNIDAVALSIWGPRNSKGKKLEFLEAPDSGTFSSRSDLPEKRSQEVYMAHICSSMGLAPDKYNQLVKKYSVQHGRHPDSVITVKCFGGRVVTLSTNPLSEFTTKKKSHTFHLFHSMGFTNLNSPGLPRYRVGIQEDDALEKLILKFKDPPLAQKRRGTKSQHQLVFRTSFYHAQLDGVFEFLKESTILSKWQTPTCQLEFIETQTVADLRMGLCCVKDCITSVYYPNTDIGELKIDDLAYWRNPAWYMIVENTVFYDGRHQTSFEMAKGFIHYHSASLQPKKIFHLRDASETRLGELEIRFGYPYRLVHQDGCMHSIVFQQAVLVEAGEERTSVFPRYTQVDSKPKQILCRIDEKLPATWIIVCTDLMEDDDYMYVCTDCAKDIMEQDKLGRETQSCTTIWRCSFRVEFDGTGCGRIMDSKNKRPPLQTRDNKNTYIKMVKSFEELIPPTPKPLQRRIYVELPECKQEIHLFRFIQPLLLLPILQENPTKRKQKPSNLANVTKPKKRNIKRKTLKKKRK